MHPALLPFFYKMTGHAAGLVGAGGAIAAIDFKNQVTLGSIIVTCVVVALAGLFTIRSKIASVWREDAEGQRAAKESLQEELAAERDSRVAFDKQQQELRHDLKNDLATAKAQLQVMEAKTDLTAALDTIRQMSETTVGAVSTTIRQGLEERDARMYALLGEIRDRLPAAPSAD
jgi:hypothetical protein